jgi:hypothetical protein
LDAGVTWDTNTQIVPNQSYLNTPSVSAFGSCVHVFWEDCRFGALPEVLYKRNPTANSVGIQNISTEIPSVFTLEQNYPNPFNPTTKIKFALPPAVNGRDLSVKLVIYDVLGCEVATLVNEPLQPGTYEIEWDAENYSSGVYYYTLQTQQFKQSKRMVLIK